MKLSETVQLLAYARAKAGPAYGGMVFPPGTAEAWHEDLEHIPFGDAKEAVRAHSRSSGQFVTINDILKHYQAIQRDRISRQPAIDAGQIRQTSPGPEWYEVKDQLAQRRHDRKPGDPARLGDALGDLAEQVERDGNAT